MPNTERQYYYEILIYLMLTAIFSGVFWALIIHAHTVEIGRGRVVHMLMWAPALAALATCTIFRVDYGTLGWRWSGRYAIAGYALPIVYGGMAYVAIWITGLGTLRLSEFVNSAADSLRLSHEHSLTAMILNLALLGSFGVIQSLASALGEEIGWRGFLLPRLASALGFTGAALVSGVVWASWHVPLIMFADYKSGTPLAFELLCFSMMIVATGTVAAWLRLKSRSLWPPAVLHASHNLFIQSVFDPLTGDAGHTAYWSGEFGAALACSSALIGFVCWLDMMRQCAANDY